MHARGRRPEGPFSSPSGAAAALNTFFLTATWLPGCVPGCAKGQPRSNISVHVALSKSLLLLYIASCCLLLLTVAAVAVARLACWPAMVPPELAPPTTASISLSCSIHATIAALARTAAVEEQPTARLWPAQWQASWQRY